VGSAFAEYVDLGSSTFTVRAAAATSLGGETTWLNDTLNDTPSSTDDLVLDSAANRYLNTLALSGVSASDRERHWQQCPHPQERHRLR